MKLLEKIKYENSRMYAYRTIFHNIITLELKPGSYLSENELSAELEISRTPIREALIELRGLELVETIPQKGNYVTKMDPELIEEARFIRCSLENSILRLACQTEVSPELMRRLQENLDQQKNHLKDTDPHLIMTELDDQFHRLLFEAAGRLRTYEFIQAQTAHFNRYRVLAFQMLEEENYERTVADHEHILAALQRKDMDLAERENIRHLTHVQSEAETLRSLCPEYFKKQAAKTVVH